MEGMPIQNNELVPLGFEPPPPVIQESQTQLNQSKGRKKKSEQLTIENVSGGNRRASLNKCTKIIPITSPIILGNKRQRYGNPSTNPYYGFNPDRCRREISKMIIMHDYPPHMVEHPGFITFVNNLQPRFDMASFNAVQGDCVATYLIEKQTLQKTIDAMPGRVCLTLDTWSSKCGIGYVFVTGHFVDSEWKIHRKILNVVMEPFPESESALSHAISACISDWNLEGRVFSVTVNQKLTVTVTDNIRALLSVKNPVVLNGQLLVGNCLARTISNIAQEAMKFVNVHETILKVRDSVKYVKTSELREEMFLELKEQLKVPSTRVLALDDRTKWNTTYEMLLAAAELKEVFCCLDTSDPFYKEPPSMEEWKVVEKLCVYLKPLFDTASILVSKTVPTTNQFFHEAWKIQLELARASLSEDKFITGVTKLMKEMFDNYWNSCCFVLAIAVVMDPRFKMKLVQFSFQKIYGEDKAGSYLKIVDDGIHELFIEYLAQPANEANNGTVKVEENGLGIGLGTGLGVGLTDFDMYIMQSTSQLAKSELDQYLEESLLPRVNEFDVLGWWNVNRMKYPTLSKMARDILSIPVFTVGKDSVFDTVSKEMDAYRCSLRPETVEAIICAKDWLQDTPTSDAQKIKGVPI